jgi:hypothetical protein
MENSTSDLGLTLFTELVKIETHAHLPDDNFGQLEICDQRLSGQSCDYQIYNCSEN